MNYQKFDSDKAFIVMQKKGTGVMEDPYLDVGIVFETNSKDEAYLKADELFHANNSPEAIKSTWCQNTYWVIANTNTEIGNKLLNDFTNEHEKRVKEAKESGNYHTYQIGDITIGVLGPKDNFMSRSMDNKVTGEEMGNATWGYDYSKKGLMFPVNYDKQLGGIQRKNKGKYYGSNDTKTDY